MFITLESGDEFEMRTLGLFELDDISSDLLGPFTFPMVMFGKTFEAEYDYTRYETPPTKPTETNPEEGTPEWDQLTDWQLYQAALLHDKRRLEKVADYYTRVRQYILKNACVSSPNLIQTIKDWERVYDAALIPQLTMTVIADTLITTYAAKFNGQDVFEAMKAGDKGRGSYNTIKLWENKLMIQLNKSEIEYAMIPLKERARKVCAMFLDDIMAYLELDFERRISGKNNAKEN
jgi:hypothetical protein